MPTWRAIASAGALGCRRSSSPLPGPAACSAAIAASESSLIVSATAMMPGRLAVDGDEHRRLAVVGQALAASARARPSAMPRSRISLALPSSTARPSTVASMPWPGIAAKVVGIGQRQARAPRAPSTIAAASGCSESRSTAAAKPQHLVLVEAVGGDHVGQRRLALA